MGEPMTAGERARLLSRWYEKMAGAPNARQARVEDEFIAAEYAAAEQMRTRCRQIADRELGWSDKNMNGVASRIALEISALTPRLFAVKGDEDG